MTQLTIPDKLRNSNYGIEGIIISKVSNTQFCMLPSYAPCFTDFRTGFVLGHIWCIWYCIMYMVDGGRKGLREKAKTVLLKPVNQGAQLGNIQDKDF